MSRQRTYRRGFRLNKGGRQISALKDVCIARVAPHAPPRATGIRAKGIAYENKLGRHLKMRVESGSMLWVESKIYDGPWLRFHDENGPGYAQPDYIIEQPDLAIVLDAKLTHTPLAKWQLLGLYKPLVSMLLSKPVVCVEVFHNIGTKGEIDCKIDDLDNIFDVEAQYYNWHWLG